MASAKVQLIVLAVIMAVLASQCNAFPSCKPDYTPCTTHESCCNGACLTDAFSPNTKVCRFVPSVPPQAACRANGVRCSKDRDCCSAYCVYSTGKCA